MKRSWIRHSALRLVIVVSAAAVPSTIASSVSSAATACTSPRDGGSDQRSRLVVTEKATKKRPAVIRYNQPPGVIFIPAPVVGPSEVYTPVHIVSNEDQARLQLRVEWATPSVSDIDVYLYRNGSTVARSEGSNVQPVDELRGDNAGEGYEYLQDVTVVGCGKYTLLTSNWHSPGEKVTVKAWLTNPT